MVYRESSSGKFLGPYYTVDICTADPETVATLAQGGTNPRSIMEYYILRRKWTPYGFARVWGSTPALWSDTIPLQKQIAALKTGYRPRPMSPAKAHRKAMREIREEYYQRITTAARLWKQRGK